MKDKSDIHRQMLTEGARKLGLTLTVAEVDRFLRYLAELKAWGKKINLTAITHDEDIITRHFLDSLTPYAFVKDGGRLLDIGAGGGFPGLPLKIVVNALAVVLLDSVAKKVHFMRHVIRSLELKGVEAVSTRAEDPQFRIKYEGVFDYSISRAFSTLPEFISLSLPYLKPGGSIIAMKGPSVSEELATLKDERVSEPVVREIKIPFTDRNTFIVVMKKR